jgi:hypothetical protein
MVTLQSTTKWSAREEKKNVLKLFMSERDLRLIMKLQRILTVILQRLRQRSRNSATSAPINHSKNKFQSVMLYRNKSTVLQVTLKSKLS